MDILILNYLLQSWIYKGFCLLTYYIYWSIRHLLSETGDNVKGIIWILLFQLIGLILLFYFSEKHKKLSFIELFKKKKYLKSYKDLLNNIMPIPIVVVNCENAFEVKFSNKTFKK